MNTDLFATKFMMNEITWSRLAGLHQTEDDIGLVLRGHLITETMLEAYCCAAVDNETLFEGFGENLTMTYAAKIQLASNLGLNEHSVAELKRVNKIRNARSHQIDNAEITDAEIDSLRAYISRGGQEDLVNTIGFGIKVDDAEAYLNRPGASNREKFIAILGAIIMRITKQVGEK
ncbi:hypothetical protein QCK43_001421 [Enterobacter cancerogenus]|nr:hypothetical protein [Enterobacter cancerogenus]